MDFEGSTPAMQLEGVVCVNQIMASLFSDQLSLLDEEESVGPSEVCQPLRPPPGLELPSTGGCYCSEDGNDPMVLRLEDCKSLQILPEVELPIKHAANPCTNMYPLLTLEAGQPAKAKIFGASASADSLPTTQDSDGASIGSDTDSDYDSSQTTTPRGMSSCTSAEKLPSSEQYSSKQTHLRTTLNTKANAFVPSIVMH
jgi:hypothetical protein